MKPKRAMLTKAGVLLVENDPVLQARALAGLQAENCEVVLASSGPQATRLFDPARINLLILDLDVLSRDGWRLLTDLLARKPRLRTILITDPRRWPRLDRLPGVDAFLAKPLDLKRLAHLVNGLVAALRTPRRSGRDDLRVRRPAPALRPRPV